VIEGQAVCRVWETSFHASRTKQDLGYYDLTTTKYNNCVAIWQGSEHGVLRPYKYTTSCHMDKGKPTST